MSRGSWERGLVEDIKGHKVRVRIPDLDNFLTDWLPVAQALTMGARLWLMPRQGAQVGVLLDDNAEDGMVICGRYSDSDPAPDRDPLVIYLETEDGTMVEIDPTAKTVKLDAAGDVLVTAKGKVEITAGGTMSLKAAGEVTIESGAHIKLKAPKIDLN